jgi:putative oxidoreductase
MTRVLDALRLLLGTVMVITALRYFMPPLLPFVPAAEWHDPMAVRLMTGFDQSGLGAVARFIHLVAGMLLLTNRAVPFALAALMPVNVCGLFIALFIEGDAVVGLLAVLTVALNGLLMLAYLPAYRGVLEADQLADGEGPEDGRNYESLFVNPLGNAPPAAYFGGALVLAAALAFYGFVVPYSNGTTGLVTLAIPALIMAVGWARAQSRRRRA